MPLIQKPNRSTAIRSPGKVSKASPKATSSPQERLSQFYGDAPARPRRPIAPALLPATWRTALGALRRHKMRSGLSALGVIIAVAAVIAMTEIGQGSKATLQKGIAGMGANTVMIFSGSTNTGGVTLGTGSAITLTPDDASEIARQFPAVSGVAPIVRARAQIVCGNRNWVPEQISGTTPSFLVVRDWQNMGMDQDNIVLAPWSTIKYRVSGTTLTNTNQSASSGSSSTSTSDAVNTLSNLYPTATSRYPSRSSSQVANYPQPVRFTNVDQIVAKAASAAKVKQAISQITELLRERHRIRPGSDDDFSIRDMAETMKMLSSTTQSMSLLLLVVALISLVVGGVGIMNIMLVSVTERTREIGLRMAVGARSYHILRQFLAEAVVLCLVGGAMGILLGRGSSILVRSIMRWPTETSLPAIIAAAAVSATVGVVFGFYPAWKASRLDPIEALRYE